MDLFREEIDFTRNLIQEMRNRGVKKFPFKTRRYYRTLSRIEEQFREEGELPTPLETLLVKNTQGEFPRMDCAVEYHFGEVVGLVAPRYEEVELNIEISEVKYPLAKRFAKKLINRLNLE